MADDLRWLILRSGCNVPCNAQLSKDMARLILVALADHADPITHTHYVSYRGLATELAISPTTTFLAYKLFEVHRVMQRTNKRKGKGGTNEYRLDFDKLVPTNDKYYLPTAFTTQGSTGHATDMGTALTSDMGTALTSDMASDMGTAPSTQARNGNGNGNGNETSAEVMQKNVQALFEQVFARELEYRPSNLDPEKLKAMKREKYTQACLDALQLYPAAQPATNPDHELALFVCEQLNPTVPALKLTPASKRELERRYKPRPAQPEQPLSPERLRELSRAQPLRDKLPKH